MNEQSKYDWDEWKSVFILSSWCFFVWLEIDNLSTSTYILFEEGKMTKIKSPWVFFGWSIRFSCIYNHDQPFEI